MRPDPEPGRWSEIAEQTLRERLADPLGSLTAFVVDRNVASNGLATCTFGVIEHRLGGPDNPSGDVGRVFNVAADRDCRRRGYSRACMQALLGWYQQRGVTRAYLRASRDGESLYRALGFAPTHSRPCVWCYRRRCSRRWRSEAALSSTLGRSGVGVSPAVATSGVGEKTGCATERDATLDQQCVKILRQSSGSRCARYQSKALRTSSANRRCRSPPSSSVSRSACTRRQEQGAVYFRRDGTVTGTRIADSTASGGGGGARVNGGGIYNSTQTTVRSTKIVGSQSDQGAGVYNDSNGSLNPFSTKIVKNIAVTDGESIFNEGGGTVVLNTGTGTGTIVVKNRPNKCSGDVPGCAG